MSSAVVHRELRSGVRKRLLTATGLPTVRAWEGVLTNPALPTPWLREQLVVLNDTPISNGVISHEVLYVVTLFYPAGKGTTDVETMAGALLDLFKVGTRFTYGTTDVLCLKAERGTVQQETQWVSIAVKVKLQSCTTD